MEKLYTTINSNQILGGFDYLEGKLDNEIEMREVGDKALTDNLNLETKLRKDDYTDLRYQLDQLRSEVRELRSMLNHMYIWFGVIVIGLIGLIYIFNLIK